MAQTSVKGKQSGPTIVHLIVSLDRGGCETQLLRLLPATHTFRHVIITLRQPGELAERFRLQGIEVLCLHQKALWHLGAYLRLRQWLGELQPSLIMTYLVHADLVGRLVVPRLGRYRVVSSLRTTHNFGKFWMARLFERATRSLAWQYVASSIAVKQLYVGHLGVAAQKITVIPNGIEVDRFTTVTNIDAARRELGLKAGRFVVIIVANLHASKGHRDLFLAFDKLWQQHNGCDLLVVGDGQERKALNELACCLASSDSIHFLGRRTDVPTLLRLGDVFVLPTRFEGMSNAILEAMAAERPIVVSDIPENRQITRHAFFVPIGSVDQLGEVLMDLYNNPEKGRRLAAAALKDVRNRYDIHVIARAWKTFYNQAIKQ